jgi:hypothetical protein
MTFSNIPPSFIAAATQIPKLASNFVYVTSFQGLSLVTQTCGVV